MPSQERFHNSAARFKAFCGPVGTGKSMALCQEAVSLAFENTGRVGLLGAPSFPMLRDATQRQLFEICERAGFEYTFNKAENKIRLLEVGSEILCRSLDDYETLRGPNLAWFGVDELTYTTAEAWQRLEARLRDPKAKRLCGFGVFTPKGFDWVHQKFVANKAEGYALIQASPKENHYILDAVPDYYERLERSYDARFYQQEGLGQFVNVRQGQAYYAFKRKDHVRETEYNSALPIHWSWDFNLTPMCSVICQRFGDEIRVLDEIVLSTSSTPEVCREFWDRWAKRSAKQFINNRLVIYGDASGAAGNTANGRSDYQMVREFFRDAPELEVSFRVPSANPAVRDRINTVNARFANARGEQRVVINPRCKGLINDLEQVSYKAGSTQLDKDSDPRRTHLSDALGYYLWQEFRPGEAVGEKTKRLL